jgi:hypothetical protein
MALIQQGVTDPETAVIASYHFSSHMAVKAAIKTRN